MKDLGVYNSNTRRCRNYEGLDAHHHETHLVIIISVTIEI